MLGYLCAVPLHKKVLFLTEIIANFAVALIKQVSVVQWIEFRIPVPTIGVRLPTGILIVFLRVFKRFEIVCKTNLKTPQRQEFRYYKDEIWLTTEFRLFFV